ncbi:hypothetical protein GJ496_000366 [Pomphorhynchus laevis]|nr:hypothetical protein GJ496_000366 [Pomphorhynchus laevis]
MVSSSASIISKPHMMTLAERIAFISATCKISKGEDSLLSWKVVKIERVTTRFKTLAKEGDGFTPIVLIMLDSLPIFVDKTLFSSDIRLAEHNPLKEVKFEEIARNASRNLKRSQNIFQCETFHIESYKIS